MRIKDQTSWCVAHMVDLAGKLWFLGKSRSNPLCLGEWVGCGCCLVRLNVGFRELSNTWKLLGLNGPCQPHGGVFRENSGFGAMGVRKLSRNGNFLLESPISEYPVPAGFLQAVST